MPHPVHPVLVRDFSCLRYEMLSRNEHHRGFIIAKKESPTLTLRRLLKRRLKPPMSVNMSAASLRVSATAVCGGSSDIGALMRHGSSGCQTLPH